MVIIHIETFCQAIVLGPSMEELINPFRCIFEIRRMKYLGLKPNDEIHGYQICRVMTRDERTRVFYVFCVRSCSIFQKFSCSVFVRVRYFKNFRVLCSFVFDILQKNGVLCSFVFYTKMGQYQNTQSLPKHTCFYTKTLVKSNQNTRFK